MALKYLIIVSIIATAHAGFRWVDDDDDNFGAFPRIPQFFIPRPHPVNFEYIPFAIPMPPIPTVDDIRTARPGPNEVYSGVAVRSSSGVTRDKDGKVVKTGGTAILVNNDGKVEEEKFGSNPPKIDDPIIIPDIPMPSFHHHGFPRPPKSHFPAMDPLPPIPPIMPIPPIPIVPIKKYKPGKNEHFVGVSSSSFSSSSNINGKKSSSGGKDTVVNVDGKVDEEVVQYGKHDKD